MESRTTTDLTPVERPNGRLYRPRKPPATRLVPDIDSLFAYIYVLRTHDVDIALELAKVLAVWEGVEFREDRPPRLIWTRIAMRDYEQQYVDDPVRGVPAVCFEVW